MERVLRSILQECRDFTWRVFDCEELVGVTHRRLWGWFYKVSFLKELGKQGLR